MICGAACPTSTKTFTDTIFTRSANYVVVLRGLLLGAAIGNFNAMSVSVDTFVAKTKGLLDVEKEAEIAANRLILAISPIHCSILSNQRQRHKNPILFYDDVT